MKQIRKTVDSHLPKWLHSKILSAVDFVWQSHGNTEESMKRVKALDEHLTDEEINDLFNSLVRAKLFLPNKEGVRVFANLLGQITMKGQPKLYGHKIVKRKRKK